MTSSSTRTYVTRNSTRRSLRSGAEFAAARGHVALAGVGVAADREPRDACQADQAAQAAADAKRARKQARRAAARTPGGQEA